MRSDRLYLLDITEATDAIGGFLAGIDRDAFIGSDLVRSAVLQKLIVIGEAAARLTEGFRTLHTEVDWRDIANFRNIAVHAYFSVDWQIVWVAATKDAPELRGIVRDIYESEYPE
jgi:uncharacterized protein with HEPN domain